MSAVVRRAVGGLVAVSVLVGLLGGCETTEAARREVRGRVNLTRSEAGLGPVDRDVALDVKADRWARKLRDACDLFHSRLAEGAPVVWHKLGENVGYGDSIAIVHQAFMDSPGHRANILDPAFSEMGSAAVWGRCHGYDLVFVVQEFMEPEPAP